MFFPAADGSAACPGCWFRGLWAGWPGGVAGRTGLGWSGRCGGRSAGGFEQVQPCVLAVPAFGQVQGEAAAAVADGPGGDGDQVAADRDGAGPAVAAAGQGAGGAQEVARDGGDGEPGGVGGELSRYDRCARGPFLRSARTCSMTAWPRCCSSAWTSSNGESVKTAW